MRTPPNERLTPHTADTVMAGTASRPERRCILTGESQPRGALLRLALSPDGVVLPDIRERAPGRGAWIHVARGSVCLNGTKLQAGDGASLDTPGPLTLDQGQDAEVLLFDMAM